MLINCLRIHTNVDRIFNISNRRGKTVPFCLRPRLGGGFRIRAIANLWGAMAAFFAAAMTE